jgi:hypothetical protein
MLAPRTRKKQHGQAVLEITIILPVLLGIFFLAVAIAAGWNVHHFSASLSLEGASLQSANSLRLVKWCKFECFLNRQDVGIQPFIEPVPIASVPVQRAILVPGQAVSSSSPC